ncbi:YesL family protein [Lihuaxuella thermophila]|uniref:Uncharacterized membrane protein YesL n=1 Tax=Lihuaxuella thermophila TaxID=1173111 RepID=A0A1H8GGW2_9BACL|nr:DUF624 domain-containing protein [Lihuaxuella thermophila]SEN43411.1 Uncharacterized membrane protein YesL [Lihuaxuella thermophila]
MFALDGILYRICTWIYHFAYLNLLFLFSCLPVITIFPATAAMFGVVRKWIKGEEPPIFTTYRKLFAENFKQSMIAGIVLSSIALILIADFYFLVHHKSSLNQLIFIMLCFACMLYISTALSIYPLMVNNYLTTKQLLINAFKIGFYKPFYTFANIILTGIVFFISLRYPFILFFFCFSLCAWITYWFADRKFAHLLNPKNATKHSDSTSTG